VSPRQSSSRQETPAPEGGRDRGAFLTTHWSAVLSAQRSDSTRAQSALASLCQTYWYPLYAYVRRRGYPPPDAQDLTQEFFARLLEQRWLLRADPQRGHFRTFLLTALSRFLANEWDRARARKRGGGVPLLALEFDTAETRYGLEPADPRTPEQIFERRWALALLDKVLERLRQESRAEGKGGLYESLRPCLVGERQGQPYAVLARQLGMSEGAVKVAVHRLRQRYRQLLREEVASTVANPKDVEEEMRHLFTALTASNP
jgi:RNA polymerase sigma factor (sigma-70 family)